MANIRHVVVVRRDLQLSPGLLAAQVAHISDSFIRGEILKAHIMNGKGKVDKPNFTPNELSWFRDPYISVLAVNCYEDLEKLMDHARSENLSVIKWVDLVPSPTFPDRSIKALVGISIGPDDFDKIKIVTGSLPLY